MKGFFTASVSTYVLCCLMLLSTAVYINKIEYPWFNTMSWDVTGYYLYLPGIFYDNLGELNNRQYIIDTYHLCGNGLDIHRGPKGKFIIKYSSGMAVMYLPAFAIGHLYAKLGNYPVDGFSPPYQYAVTFYSVLIAFIGLWFARKILLKYFSETVTAITLFAIVFTTNYLNFAAITNALSHNYLFTVYAIIIYLSYGWVENFTYKRSAAIGFLCGLAALTRPTDIISILIPFIWNIGNLTELKARVNSFLRQYKKIIVLLLCAVAVGSIQLIYWRYYTGSFLYWSYHSDEHLNLLKVYFHQVLFSYKKGWFVYTPFMILSIAGFITLYRQYKNLFWCSFAVSFLGIYLVMCWSSWSYGGSFSMRAVIQYYAILIFPLASFISYAVKRWFTAVPFYLFLMFCTWLNLVMTYQANWGGIMESDNMSKAYYWRIFGKLHIDRNDRKLIETDEEAPKKLEGRLSTIITKDFAADSGSVDFNGERVFLFDTSKEFLPEIITGLDNSKSTWYRFNCKIYFGQFEPDFWKQLTIYAWIADNKGKEIKKKWYRLQRVVFFKKWDTVFIDIKSPVNPNAAKIHFGIYNPQSNARVFVKQEWVERTEE